VEAKLARTFCEDMERARQSADQFWSWIRGKSDERNVQQRAGDSGSAAVGVVVDDDPAAEFMFHTTVTERRYMVMHPRRLAFLPMNYVRAICQSARFRNRAIRKSRTKWP